MLLVARRVSELRAPLGSVIVEVENHAVGRANAMDHTGLEISHEDLVVHPIEGHVSQRCASIFATVQREVGEYARLIIIRRVEAVNGAGAAALPPHTGHPLGRAGREVEPEC